ncbi:MAG TPA: ShlB/FhaC/HecB family hemolysin secretion/activation protein [Opitutaceae bacterium]|nr:ShlB/FhaC/HecB family hemolysin secretion/activation protein [Opitutaceae bacterium]
MLLRSVSVIVLSLLASALSFAADAPEIYPLKKLLLADSEAKATALAAEVSSTGLVYAQELPLYATAEFEAVVAPYAGRPISIEMVNELIAAIMRYAGTHDYLIARVLVPQGQRIDSGVLRLAVILGRYADFAFQGNNRWFSQKLIRQRLGLKPGDEVRLSTLEEAVNWLNTNPFRQVKVLVNEVPNQPGKGQLVLNVQETLPLRAAFSFDDTGNDIIGKHHYAGLISYGNLWGQDHQASYNFITTDNPKVYQGHALEYRAPLPSRHFVQFTANYVRTNPTFAGGFFTQKGENLSTDLRYTIPLRSGNQPRDLWFGVNFKESNNNLAFGGTQLFNSKTDTFHVFGGYSMVSRDTRGAWLLAGTVNVSPGNINSRNTTAALAATRSGAHASYIYGTLSAQRLQALPHQWQVWWRANLQVSSHNLISGEQLLIGGANTVRGYEENVFAGENGFVFDTDLMTPALRKKIPFLPQKAPPLETRLLAFLDMAKTEYKERFASDIILASIASTGVGIRSSLGNNFSLSFDYGWQLMHMPRQASQRKGPPLDSRGHIKVVLAF